MSGVNQTDMSHGPVDGKYFSSSFTPLFPTEQILFVRPLKFSSANPNNPLILTNPTFSYWKDQTAFTGFRCQGLAFTGPRFAPAAILEQSQNVNSGFHGWNGPSRLRRHLPQRTRAETSVKCIMLSRRVSQCAWLYDLSQGKISDLKPRDNQIKRDSL